MTKIVTISDTHNKHWEINVPEGDILLFAGDCSGRGSFADVEEFIMWLKALPHAYKVMIAGNHDFGFENDPQRFARLCKDNGIIYLNDSSVEVLGIKIHGSPVTPEFYNWAFNRSRTIEDSMTKTAQFHGHGYIGNHWDKIPEDTDILITHGPVYDILDKTDMGVLTGCECLLRHIKERLSIKMHVFGHIHEGRGIEVRDDCGDQVITFVNTSSLDSSYYPQQEDTFVFDWDEVINAKVKIEEESSEEYTTGDECDEVEEIKEENE